MRESQKQTEEEKEAEEEVMLEESEDEVFGFYGNEAPIESLLETPALPECDEDDSCAFSFCS